MSVVVVAGGLGDLGRPIVDALFGSGKHEVYIMSRKVPDSNSIPEAISPLSSKPYNKFLQTDYASESSLLSQLTAIKATTIICAFPMDSDIVCNAQLRLIRAADASPTTSRFIPSEFNVEYDADDSVLPYPEKKFHLIAREELSKTKTLEYTYIYPGMFMDYFGLPKIPSSLRPLVFCVDPEAGIAILPANGEGRMSMTFTTDFARLLVQALELRTWPKMMTTVVSTVSMNELVEIYKKVLRRKLEVRYQSVEKLLKHETDDLPVNLRIMEEYPGRFPQGIRGLIADLEACVACGGYDVDKWQVGLDLVKEFDGKVPGLKRIEDLVREAWGHLGSE